MRLDMLDGIGSELRCTRGSSPNCLGMLSIEQRFAPIAYYLTPASVMELIGVGGGGAIIGG